MDIGTVIRAINNLPASRRQDLLGRIAEMVVEALAGEESSAGGRRRLRDTNGSTKKKPTATATEEEVLAHIKANPAQRTEQISAALGSDAKPVLKKLREAKLIRTKGQKRAMTYSVAGKN